MDLRFTLGLNVELLPRTLSFEVLNTCLNFFQQTLRELRDVGAHSLLHKSGFFVSCERHLGSAVFDVKNVDYEIDIVFSRLIRIHLILSRGILVAFNSPILFEWLRQLFLVVAQYLLLCLSKLVVRLVKRCLEFYVGSTLVKVALSDSCLRFHDYL